MFTLGTSGAGLGLGPFKMQPRTPKGQAICASRVKPNPVRRAEVVIAGEVRCQAVELVVKTVEPDGSRLKS